MAIAKRMLGEYLLSLGLINERQLLVALEEQKHSLRRLGRILVDNKYLAEEQLFKALETLLDVTYVNLGKVPLNTEVIKILPFKLIKKYKMLPLFQQENVITVAMSDPLNRQALDDARMAAEMNVVAVLTDEKGLDVAISQYLSSNPESNLEFALNELTREIDNAAADKQTEEEPFTIDTNAPIIRMVDSIISQAVQSGASDIHIEPLADSIRVRFRIDGELHRSLSLPRAAHAALVSRVKVLANMDIAERRLPQDGRFKLFLDGEEIDFRVSTMPVVYGEKLVLRILDRSNAHFHLNQIGFDYINYERVMKLLQKPYGMILAVGPTGSGKTTTLYSLINQMNSAEINIITLEDPVEYSIYGINQVQTNIRTGLSFAAGLRSILRQDPDVIMVGEIRDYETAQLAIHAALTGHLVFSTLHTNSAVGTISRLHDMGIEGFLLASALSGVIAQRLVRKLCPNCREEYVLSKDEANNLGLEADGQNFFKAVGCHMCGYLGYRGRTAIHEIMLVDPEIKRQIVRGSLWEESIERSAVDSGMVKLKLDGIQKARQGLTSLEEVMKVVWLKDNFVAG